MVIMCSFDGQRHIVDGICALEILISSNKAFCTESKDQIEENLHVNNIESSVYEHSISLHLFRSLISLNSAL